jgi:hypothetical protein
LIDAIELEDGLVEEESASVTEETEQAALLITDEAGNKTAAAAELTAQKESENATIAAEAAKIGRITDLLSVEITEKRGALARTKEIITDKQAQLAKLTTMRLTTAGNGNMTAVDADLAAQ